MRVRQYALEITADPLAFVIQYVGSVTRPTDHRYADPELAEVSTSDLAADTECFRTRAKPPVDTLPARS